MSDKDISTNGTTEKILVGSIQKFSVEDGPGIRTTVFLKGCSLNCLWCHNPELIDPEQQLIQSPNNCIGCGYCVKVCPVNAVSISQETGVTIDRDKCDMCLKCADNCCAKALRPVAIPMTIDDILSAAEQDKSFYDNTGGGVTISGGEMLAHAGFVNDLIDEAGKRGIYICLDTCGYGDPQSLMNLALKDNVTDILYDIKSVDDTVHKKCTGASNELIIDNLKMLSENNDAAAKLTIRMPLIKGVNDSDDIIHGAGTLYRELGIERVDLLPYHSLGVNKKKNVGGLQEEFQQPSEDRLTEIASYFKDEIHLKVGILGRV